MTTRVDAEGARVRSSEPRRSGRCPRTAGVAAIVAGVALLGGCAGNGKYTSEHSSAAKEKMAIMKSATEWDMARQSFLTGDLDKAIKGVDRSLAINPKVPKSHVLRGRILMERGDMEGAVASFKQALEIDPEFVDAVYYLGLVHERLNQHEQALAQYTRAAELDPQNAQYIVAACEVMIDQGRVSEAKSFIEARAESFSHTAGVKQTMGHLALIEDRPQDAVSYFNDARLLAPEDLSILEDLARAQVSSREFGEAEASIARLLAAEENKERRDLKLLRARCLIETDRPLEAREIIIRLTSDQEGASDVESWILLGNLSYTLKDANRARLSAQRIVGLAPDRPEGYLLRGLQQRRQGQLDAAAKSFQEAAQRDPSAKSLVLLGLTNQELGRSALAREQLQAALQKDPNNVEAQNLLTTIASAPTE
jgi:tetratricopeptide (TPR) repeat protein